MSEYASQQRRQPPLKLYYGWILVATLGVTETISWGILYYAFSVYLTPIGADLQWSRGDMSGAFSFGLLIAGLAAIPVGRWLDRHGPRALMTVGSILAHAHGARVVERDQPDPVLPDLGLGIGLAMSGTLYDPRLRRRRAGSSASWRALTVITLLAGFASTIFCRWRSGSWNTRPGARR
jgi:MFS family permease